MALNSYFDFADDDYLYFKRSFDDGIIANSMGAMAQSICERYIKHLISEYFIPETISASNDKQRILKTHSLTKLISFLRHNMDIEFSKECESELRMIDGFYFTTRYPGDDSIELDRFGLNHCMEAIKACRAETIKIAERIG